LLFDSLHNAGKELRLSWHNILINIDLNKSNMPNWLRAIIAGYGAKKMGGGCIGTILVFVILYYLLGYC
jgi:hypothetical protein